MTACQGTDLYAIFKAEVSVSISPAVLLNFPYDLDVLKKSHLI